jgi:hypothetical protein
MATVQVTFSGGGHVICGTQLVTVSQLDKPSQVIDPRHVTDPWHFEESLHGPDKFRFTICVRLSPSGTLTFTTVKFCEVQFTVAFQVIVPSKVPTHTSCTSQFSSFSSHFTVTLHVMFCGGIGHDMLETHDPAVAQVCPLHTTSPLQFTGPEQPEVELHGPVKFNNMTTFASVPAGNVTFEIEVLTDVHGSEKFQTRLEE